VSAAGAARRWICCADDYALDAPTSTGIATLLHAGRLTATSVLVESPLWRGAARELPVPPAAAIGLHLNFTQAFPAQAGPVWGLGEFLLRCRLGALPRAPIAERIERQLDAFEDGLGRAPDYVDGHQHVHQFAIVREALVAALVRRYGAQGPWLRSTRPPPGLRDAKARLIGALGEAALRQLAVAAGLRSSAWLVGVYGFQADAAGYRRHLHDWLQAGPDGSVLMCHPARGAAPGDPIGAAREVEFAVFSSEVFDAALARAGVQRVAALPPPH
jgi:predicted glycoside hydrolase/deacetylase ChbG (UPF0249 family)